MPAVWAAAIKRVTLLPPHPPPPALLLPFISRALLLHSPDIFSLFVNLFFYLMLSVCFLSPTSSSSSYLRNRLGCFSLKLSALRITIAAAQAALRGWGKHVRTQQDSSGVYHACLFCLCSASFATYSPGAQQPRRRWALTLMAWQFGLSVN